MHPKMLDLVVNHPTGPLLDPTAQQIIAAGVLLFFVCWGIAKIIRSFKGD